jgi:hypothetical protein
LTILRQEILFIGFALIIYIWNKGLKVAQAVHLKVHPVLLRQAVQVAHLVVAPVLAHLAVLRQAVAVHFQALLPVLLHL